MENFRFFLLLNWYILLFFLRISKKQSESQNWVDYEIKIEKNKIEIDSMKRLMFYLDPALSIYAHCNFRSIYAGKTDLAKDENGSGGRDEIWFFYFDISGSGPSQTKNFLLCVTDFYRVHHIKFQFLIAILSLRCRQQS